jgi:hypothetical protein
MDHRLDSNEQLHQITVSADVVPGPYTEMVAERMLHVLVHTLLEIGADVTAVRIEILGDISTW